jgi:hypothetical protein
MNKNRNALIVLLVGAAFIGLLYYSNSGSSSTTGSSGSGGVYSGILAKISSMEKLPYDRSVYMDVNGRIMGAFSAGELSQTQQSDLKKLLEIGKSKALILSFDAAQNQNCMNLQALSGICQELIAQQKQVDLPEATRRIAMYQNLRQFLSFEGGLSGMGSREFNYSDASNLEAAIRTAAARPGPVACSAAQAAKSEWLSRIGGYRNIYESYNLWKNKPDNLDPEDYVAYPYYHSMVIELTKDSE